LFPRPAVVLFFELENSELWIEPEFLLALDQPGVDAAEKALGCLDLDDGEVAEARHVRLDHAVVLIHEQSSFAVALEEGERGEGELPALLAFEARRGGLPGQVAAQPTHEANRS
jgi:hypothetical protein